MSGWINVVRNCYFPSSGSPSVSPSFHPNWGDTSAADRIAGAFDVETGTSFAIKSGSWVIPYNGAHPSTTVLLRQYVFPAFGSHGQINPFSLGGPSSGWHTTSPNAVPNLITVVRAARVSIVGGSGIINNAAAAYMVNAGGVPVSQALLVNALGNSLGATLAAVNFGSGGSQNISSTTYFPAPTDHFVLEIGFNLHSLSAVTITYDAEIDFGDSAGVFLSALGQTAQYDPGVGFVYMVAAGAITSPSGGGVLKATHPSRKAERFQYPPVANRDSSILNEFILNGRIL